MPKWLKVVLISVGSLIVISGVGLLILIKSVEPKIPRPKSDVPVEYKIGWWVYQEALSVDKLETEIIFNKLNLFNAKSLIEYRISGTLKYNKVWEPYIKSVFLSERWLSDPQNFTGNQGEILLIPVVDVKNNDDYNGEPVSFQVTVQDYLNTGGWGKNTYKVICRPQETIIELQQRK